MPDQHPITIIALTEPGQKLAVKLQGVMPNAIILFKPRPFAKKVQDAFLQNHKLIFICATGIVVRTLAPVLGNKSIDPPVLVLDEQGQFVIPLLSGHEGGANEWGRCIAESLRVTCVTTTAGHYTRPFYTIGMGCERGCSIDDLRLLLQQAFHQTGLELSQIHSLHSIALKADEVGLIQLAGECQIPYQTHSAQSLALMEHLLSQKSEYVFNVTGVYGVAESAALLGAKKITGCSSELVLEKIKSAKATCAIARSYLPKGLPSKIK